MNITWIEINLPYSTDSLDPMWFWNELVKRGITEPVLLDEEQALFGATRDALWEPHKDQIGIIQDMREYTLPDDILSEGQAPLDNDAARAAFNAEVDRRFDVWIAKHPEYQEAWEAQQIRQKIKDWRQAHPAWVSYRARYDALREEENQKTFRGRGLAKPGTLVEMEDGTRHLIGGVNTLGGICDDCTAFTGEDIVVRYAVLIKWPITTGTTYQHYNARHFIGQGAHEAAAAFLVAATEQCPGEYPFAKSSVGTVGTEDETASVVMDNWPDDMAFGAWFDPLMEKHLVEIED